MNLFLFDFLIEGFLNFLGSGTILTILSLWGFLLLFSYLHRRFILRRQIRKLVKTTNEGATGALDPDSPFAKIEPGSIRGLNWKHFAEVEQELAPLGFRAGDFEHHLETAESISWIKSANRTFFREDGQIIAVCFHQKTFGWRRLLQRLFRSPAEFYTVSFNTWLADGAVVATGRTNEDPNRSRPADSFSIRYPLSTPLSEIYETHQRQIREVLENRAVEQWHPIRNDSDLIDFHRYAVTRTNEHKKTLGPVSIEDFEKLYSSLDNKTRRILQEEVDQYGREQSDRRQLESV